MENGNITIREERISAEEYIEFLKRTDLGSQYPKERFAERISRLVLQSRRHERPVLRRGQDGELRYACRLL